MLSDLEIEMLKNMKPDEMVAVTARDALRLYHGFYVAFNILQEFSVARMEAEQSTRDMPGIEVPVFVELETMGAIVLEANQIFGNQKTEGFNGD